VLEPIVLVVVLERIVSGVIPRMGLMVGHISHMSPIRAKAPDGISFEHEHEHEDD
jgi:hypothetical protein